MLNGFYTAASGMLMQQRSLDVLTNNMANLYTPGFRASRLVSTTFEHALMTRMVNGNYTFIGKGEPIRVVSEVLTKFDPNYLRETGRPFDLAINGEGFYNIRAFDPVAVEEGEDPEDSGEGAIYLTRNGNFDVDEGGFLILRDQGYVLDEDGEPIEVGGAYFSVLEDGTILNELDGKEIAKLLVTLPMEDAEIKVFPNGMYQLTDPEAIDEEFESPMIIQGWLEQANIDFNHEMSLVIEAQRAFQASSQALQVIDRINQKAATQIASL